MGNMLINVLAFAVMQGLNGALESFVPVAFGASKSERAETDEKYPKYKNEMRQQCGILYNRARFVVTIIMVPIILIYAFSDKILVAIGQDKEVSRVARTYCCVMIPGVWSMGQFDATRKFLSS